MYTAIWTDGTGEFAFLNGVESRVLKVCECLLAVKKILSNKGPVKGQLGVYN